MLYCLLFVTYYFHNVYYLVVEEHLLLSYCFSAPLWVHYVLILFVQYILRDVGECIADDLMEERDMPIIDYLYNNYTNDMTAKKKL